MAGNVCPICGQKIPLLNDVKLKDGNICSTCLNTAGYRANSNSDKLFYSVCSVSQIKDFIEAKRRNTSKTLMNVSKIGKLYFDDMRSLVYYDGGFLSKVTFNYSDIFDAGIIDDSATTQKISLGNAIIGGAIAGPAGLVLGGLGCKKIKSVCSNLKVEIDLVNRDPIFVTLIKSEVKTKSYLYKSSLEMAHSILSKIQQIIINNRSSEILEDTGKGTPNTISVAEEIAKYYELLNAGAITQEEFEALKAKAISY